MDENLESLFYHGILIPEKEMKKDRPIPIIIGENVHKCPVCDNPLSFSHDHYFCRTQNCDYNLDPVSASYERFLPVATPLKSAFGGNYNEHTTRL